MDISELRGTALRTSSAGATVRRRTGGGRLSRGLEQLIGALGRSPRVAVALALLCALGLGALSLPVGFVYDDHFHRVAFLVGDSQLTPENLFAFSRGDRATTLASIARGLIPWWTDPEFKLTFFRPLSSALIRLDWGLFGERPVLHHLHSVLWGLALVAAAALLLRRLGGTAVFGVALLVFALDEAHSGPVGWLSNRNALVAAVFGLLAVEAHLRWRLEGFKLGAALSALLLALALAGAEAAVGAFLYLVAFEATSSRPWKERLAALVPTAVVMTSYAVLYRLGGYGARGSDVYIEPMRDPAELVTEVPARLFSLLGCLGLNFPAELWVLELPSVRYGLTALGVLTVALFAWLLRALRRELDERERRLHDFFLAGALLSLLPGLSTYPAGRVLALPSLGAAAVLALLFRQLWHGHRDVLLGLLLLVHGPMAASQWVSTFDLFGRVGRQTTEAALRTELERDVANLRVILITSGDGVTAGYTLPILRASGMTMPRDWWVLSNAQDTHRLSRTGPATLELETVQGRFLESFGERIMRSPQRTPFAVGDVIELDGGRITVLAVVDGHPRRIRLEVDEPFESPDVRLLEWRDGALRRARLPNVGETVELPMSPGVVEQAMSNDAAPG